MAQGQAHWAPHTQGLGPGAGGQRPCGEVLGAAQSRVVSEEKMGVGRHEDPSEASAPHWAPTLCPEAGAGVQWGMPWLGRTCYLENKGVAGGFEQESDRHRCCSGCRRT